MKDMMLFGGLAVGGYLLFRYLSNQETSLASAIASTVTSTTTTATGSSSLPVGYITPTLRSRILQFAESTQPYAGWYSQNSGLMVWWAWMQCYTAVVGHTANAIPHDIHQGGDAYTAGYTLDEFVATVNDALSPITNYASLSGLGVLAINQPYTQSRLGYANKYLPHNLELFNAMVK